jgi:NAD(P)-dependent dehydrogenase (short-subunit alcohol dehydrogenase family)
VLPIVEFPEEDFDRVMAVNIRGVFLGMKYVLPRMRDGGPVVNMSSALGVVGAAGIVAYVASKHAVIGMTKTVAVEQGPRGIRVNAAAPGPVAGRMTFKLADEVFAGSSKSFAETVPLGRHGTPEDVAGLVSFLLSDDSSYATGTTHAVDGGFTTLTTRPRHKGQTAAMLRGWTIPAVRPWNQPARTWRCGPNADVCSNRT